MGCWKLFLLLLPCCWALQSGVRPRRGDMFLRCAEMPLPVVISEAQPADLPEASHILIKAFNEALTDTVFLALALREHKRLASNHGQRHHAQLLARYDGQAVGYVDVDFRDHRKPYTPYVSDLAVRPDCRRRKVATQLLERCEDIASKRWHCDEIFLKVESTNPTALRLYTNLGYHVCKEDSTTSTLRKSLTDDDDGEQPGPTTEETAGPPVPPPGQQQKKKKKKKKLSWFLS